jgi:hypothetical protein
MKFQGALVEKEQVRFAIVAVEKNVLDSAQDSNRTIKEAAAAFPKIPIVLMARDSQGLPSYYGRKDIGRLLAKVDLKKIRWREYVAK